MLFKNKVCVRRAPAHVPKMGTIFGAQNRNSLQPDAQPSATKTVTIFLDPEEELITTTCAAERGAHKPNTRSNNCDRLLSPSCNSLQTSALPSFRARGTNGTKTNSQHGGRSVCKLWEPITTQCAAELRARAAHVKQMKLPTARRLLTPRDNSISNIAVQICV